MSFIIFVVQPWRGRAEKYDIGVSRRDRDKEFRKWLMHEVGESFCRSSIEIPVWHDFALSQGRILAVARLTFGKTFCHPGMLVNVQQRVLRDYMFFRRRRCLHELVFSEVIDFRRFCEPWQVSVCCGTRVGTSKDLFMLTETLIGNVLF